MICHFRNFEIIKNVIGNNSKGYDATLVHNLKFDRNVLKLYAWDLSLNHFNVNRLFQMGTYISATYQH